MRILCHAFSRDRTTKQKAQPCELGNQYGTDQVFLAPQTGHEPVTYGLTENQARKIPI